MLRAGRGFRAGEGKPERLLCGLALATLLAAPLAASAVEEGRGPVPADSPAAFDPVIVEAQALTTPTPAEADPALPVESEAEHLLFPEPAPAPPMPTGPNAPPRLLWRHTPPDPRGYPLVRAPTLATREPIPRRGAGNCVRRDERGRFMGWMDHQQCVFSGRALVTARWVDDFFGDWHDDEASMMARLVFHTGLTESEGLESKVTLRASASLPNANRRLRLIITDETDEPQVGQDQRRQLGQEDSRVSAALRWLAYDRAGLDSSFDIGVRGVAPPDLFARYRLRKTWSLTDDSIARLSQTVRYGSDSKERYTPVLDFERALDDRTVLRFSNFYDYRHESRDEGFNWTHGVSLSRALAGSRSFSYGYSVRGLTRPEWRGENHGPWIIYRRPFLRPWLYYEIEPHYTWYRDRDWEGLASILLRVEMQFGSKE